MLTPQTKNIRLKKFLKLGVDLYLKREDRHPYGSHKGRSVPLMIKKYTEQGYFDFVISSSGNAGISAIHAVNDWNKTKKQKINLKIFLGKNINQEKLAIIKKISDQKYTIWKQVVNPKQQAFLSAKQNNTKILRQSTDDLALLGYLSLAKELVGIKNLSAIFISTSSGTTAQGLYEGFKKLEINPQIHIVQTVSCHSLISSKTDETTNQTEISLADAIVDKIGHRKKMVTEAIKNSRGKGWIINNQEIKSALTLAKKSGITISPTSALSIAGLKKALDNDWTFTGPVVCLVTGK